MIGRGHNRLWSFVGGTSKAAQAAPLLVPLSQPWFDELAKASPNWRKVFEETVSPDFVDAQRAAGIGHSMHSSQGPQQGDERYPLVVGVTDDIRVRSFASRHGLKVTRLHDDVQKEDHPFVQWLRRRGAFFVGKVSCATPFAFTESSELTTYPAASAVASGACDVALVASVVGAAGSNAAVVEDVVSFKTSRNALPRANPPWSRGRSIGLVTKDYGTLSDLWSDVVGGHTSALLGESMNIGVPVEWIDRLNDAPGAGMQLVEALNHAIGQTADLHTSQVEVRPVAFDFDPREAINAATTIANFELAEGILKRGFDGTGVLEELPSTTVSAIFQGKSVTEREYEAAKQVAEAMRADFEEEMGDCDASMIPIMSAPFQSGNLRSIAGTLPFSLMACPMLSMRVPLPKLQAAVKASSGKKAAASKAFKLFDGDNLPLFLVGEPGQDSQVVEVGAELWERLR